MSEDFTAETPPPAGNGGLLHKPLDRRSALGLLVGGIAVGAQALSSCAPLSADTGEEQEVKRLAWQEYIKGNYRTMTRRSGRKPSRAWSDWPS